MPYRPQQTLEPRYGCQECRDDAEMVLGGRAHESVEAMYRAHLGTCSDCRRFDRVLRDVYAGPSLPPAPDLAAQAREFSGILERVEESRGQGLLHRLAPGATVAGLTAVAAALALSLLSPGLMTRPGVDASRVVSSLAAAELDQTIDDEIEVGEGGIEHHAQSFGRVVAGDVDLDAGNGAGRSAALLESFPVGTRIDALGPDSVQVALVGKMLASIEAGARLEWAQASPELVELRLDRGMLAIRYDRRPADPILHIKTPSAIVRVVGTVFTVEVTEGKTYVSVLRGHVEVLDPTTHRLIGEVDAGYRYDVAGSTYGDVGRREVEIAIPVSNEFDFEAGEFVLADGRIPSSWVVPGLSDDPEQRRLEALPDLGDDEVAADPRRLSLNGRRRNGRKSSKDDGEDLMAMLVAEVERTKEAEVRRDLERCRTLYASAETRFRAASCLTRFTRRYADEPGAAEGYLMIGILRMDFAQDHQSASKYFEQFLARAPNHELAELAHYRLWLAATERGMISEALDNGKNYLERYPNGRFVGRILQRFPELKTEL